jgi:L-asparaginase
MAKIQLIATGGTIAMSKDKFGKSVPAFTANDLLNKLPQSQQDMQWSVLNFSNVASCNMSPAKMLALSIEIQNLLKDPDLQGVIITHGTDTLEETAYFLDLTIDDPRPIILTAAQRDASESDTDGPRNIKNALLIVLNKQATGRGVLICFNEEIFAARDVRKLHTSQVNAFSSGSYGALGFLDGNRVIWNRRPAWTVKLKTPKILANVPICKIYTGMTAADLQHLEKAAIAGLVFEAFGRGNIPPDLVSFVEQTVSRGIPVVITSRCLFGNTAPAYGYPGGGADLERVGAWFAQDLSTEKVRLLMSVALGSGLSRDELKKIIQLRGIGQF